MRANRFAFATHKYVTRGAPIALLAAAVAVVGVRSGDPVRPIESAAQSTSTNALTTSAVNPAETC